MAEGTVTKEVRTVFRADTRQQDRAMALMAKQAQLQTRALRGLRGDLKVYREADAAAAKQAEAERRLNKELERRPGLMGKVGSKLAVMAGALGAGFGVGKLIGINSEIEDTRLSIASLMRQADVAANGPINNFTKAFEASAEAIAMMRQEAIDTPGSFKDVERAYRSIVVNARMAGATQRQIIRLSSNVATMDVMSGGQGVVGNDVRQMLMGMRGGNINTPALRAISDQTAKLVRGGKSAEALGMITVALDIPEDERRAFGESFSGLMESAKDSVYQITAALGQPLFKAVTRQLKQWVEWLTKNREEVERIARLWGERIVKALTLAWQIMRVLAEATSLVVDFAVQVNEALDGIPALAAAAYIAFTRLSKHPLLLALVGAAEAWRGLSGAQEAGGRSPEMLSGPASAGQKSRWAAEDAAARKFPMGSDAYWAEVQRLERDASGAAAGPGGLMDAIAKGKGAVNVDARGAKINVRQEIHDTDSERLAGATLEAAFGALVRTPMSGTMGLQGLVLVGR